MNGRKADIEQSRLYSIGIRINKLFNNVEICKVLIGNDQN